MQPLDTKCAEVRPRLHGIRVLTSAIVLGLLYRHFIAAKFPLICIFLLTGVGIMASAAVLICGNGSRMNRPGALQTHRRRFFPRGQRGPVDL